MDYTALAAKSGALIKKYGDAVTITVQAETPGANPYDPPVLTTQSLDSFGVFTKYEAKDIDGDRVKQGDELVILSATASALPLEGQATLTRGTEVWRVIKLSIVKPGPVVIIYKAQVRR